MKRFSTLLAACMCTAMSTFAQGWPANYGGVMLQAFYWDGFAESKWKTLEAQADELSSYFKLIWVPQSGNCSGTSMGYNPKYFFDQNSSFGTSEELKSMIGTFKNKGLGTIEDVVINHHDPVSGWLGFPSETYGGNTYQLLSTDICADDDSGKTKTNNPSATLSSNNDEGDDFDGCRDLDHKSSNVQTIVKAYEKMLVEDYGYIGFRYDVAKGFNGSHIGDYNSTVGVQYSVGEYWDGNASTVENWIKSTKVNDNIQSAAFDFPFRYSVSHAIQKRDWTMLAETGINSSSDYRRYAITFVENHDVEARDGDKQDCIASDTLAANAWLLANPGTPCVFFKHWMYCKNDIAKMIAARKLVGINNQSTYSPVVANSNYYAREVTGTNGKMIVCVGYNDYMKDYSVDGYKTLLSGTGYKYLVPNDFNTGTWAQTLADIDANVKNVAKPSIPNCATKQTGIYAYFEAPSSWTGDIYAFAWNDLTSITGAWPGEKSTVTKVGTHGGKGVYLWKCSGTTAPKYIIFDNGQGGNTNQTADFPFYNGGYYTFRDSYVGFADGNGEEEKFVIPSFATKQDGIYAYFEKPDTWGNTINAYMWTDSEYYSWPGSPEDVKYVDINTNTGCSVYLWKYSGTKGAPANIIFNDGSNQTADLVFHNGDYYNIEGLKGNVSTTAISEVSGSKFQVSNNKAYNLAGQQVDNGYKGIVIIGGKKVMR